MDTPTRIDPERINVLATRLKLWLLDVCLWLSEWMGRALPRDMRMMLREDIRRGLTAARVIMFMHAMARCGDAAPQGACPGPRAAPRGFRLTNTLDNDLRSMCRAVRLRGRTIAGKLRALRDVLDNPEVWIARVRRRLLAAPDGARLVLCFAIATRMCELAVPTPAPADTS